MWEVHIRHEGLRASRILKGTTQADAQWKATAQLLRWDRRWLAQQRTEDARHRLDRRQLTLHGLSIAAARTAEAARHIAALESLLTASLQTGIFLCWDDLKDTSPFTEPPILCQPRRTPPPQLLKELYAAELTPLDAFLPGRRSRKEREAAERYQQDLRAWQTACASINRRAAEEDSLRRRQREQNRHRHHAAQLAQHARVDQTRAAFLSRETDAVEFFFAEVLSRSCYPTGFPQEATLHYLRPTKTLIVDYELPAFSAWPAYGNVRYIAARNALQELPISDTWARSSYESALYQITLRVLHELFTHDQPHTLDRIAFNGWVRSIDKATGNMMHARLLSIVVARDAFIAINLNQVDPQACFRKLKGIASSKPLDLVSVRSLMPINKQDSRFPDQHPKLSAFEELQDEGHFDLASMHRSDFETLIHEAFERAFRKNPAQLRIAQTLHDATLDTLI